VLLVFFMGFLPRYVCWVTKRWWFFNRVRVLGHHSAGGFLKGYVYWVTTVLVVFNRVRVLGHHSAGGF
jgi:hypothetical protein